MTGMNKDGMKDNSNERSLHDILSDEIDRQLKENPPKKPSLEEFKAMAYKRLEENDSAADTKTVIDADTDSDSDNRETVWTKIKTNRALRTACVVACFAAAFVIGGAIFSAVTSDVDADKNPKEEIVTENGVIIEDGGWGSSVGEEDVWTTEDWEHVEDAKEIYENLAIPQYIPRSYEFKHLIVENDGTTSYTAEYIFSNKQNILEIEIYARNSSLGSLNIDDDSRILLSNNGTIYVQKNNKLATMQIADGIIINIWGRFSDEELIMIFEGFKV